MNSRTGRWNSCWKSCLLLAATGMLLIAVDSAHAQQLTGTDVNLTSAFPQVTFNDNVGTLQVFRFLGFDQDFRFEDVTAGTIPFLIAAGAPTGSIRVDASGNVGIGTFFPASDLHIQTPGLLPALRLESTNGTSPYTWDLEGSAGGFNLVDVVNANTIPFGVSAGAPANSFLIGSNGNVGIGTATPSSKLHVHKLAQALTSEQLAQFSVSDDAIGKLVISNANNVNGSFVPKIQGTSAGAAGALGMEGVITSDTGSTAAIYYSARTAAGGQLSKRPLVWYLNNGTLKVSILANGHITASAFDVVSSRTMKDNITDLDSRTASEALRQLTPVEFVYKDDPAAEKQVGFIAEDVPEIVANADRKSVPVMDVLALVTRVVKDQQQTIDEQKKSIDAQRQANDDQQKVIDELLQRLIRLEGQMQDKK